MNLGKYFSATIDYSPVPRSFVTNILLPALAAGALFVLPLIMATARAASPSSPDTVLATVGNLKITQRQVDDMVAQQMLQNLDATKAYEMRKKALDEIIGNYLIEQAAKKAGVTTDQYLKSQLSAGKITETDARKLYQANKELQAQAGGQKFEQIKAPLMLYLQKQQDEQLHEQLIARLKSQATVSIMLKVPRYHVLSAGHPSIGGKDAPVTIIEFADFQCPFCSRAENSLKAIRAKYGDKVRLTYMDFPLEIHPHSMDAARAGRCADEQGKFWQFHDAMLANQAKLAPADLKATAKKLGLDSGQFASCFDSRKPDPGIRKDMAEAHTLGVRSTPTFFIDGRELLGAQPPAKFEEVIDEEIANLSRPANSAQARAN